MVAERYAEQVGIELVWGRVFYLYGPDETPERLVPAVIRSLLAGTPTPTRDGHQVRDFMHVNDAACFAGLLDSHVTGPVNVASGEPVAARTVIEKIASLTGRPELVDWEAIATSPGDPPVLVADIARLRDEVGFTPAFGLDQGIESTVAWWRERLDG